MGFNYALEKAKFEREWNTLRAEYERAGMSEEKIEIMHDFDWTQFKKERIYSIHKQEFRVFYCDEFGTMPPFDVLPLFSAGRSRKLTLVPIIQSLAQLEKNYGKEGAEIIADNCQDTIFGGFAPNSQTAETLSKALGSRTVLTGSISKGKDSNSQSLQMAERALLSPDELKSLPKGEFVVMKTGTHPMRTKLQLYFKWGIKFEEPYQTPERAQREVYYAGKEELLMNIKKSLYSKPQQVATPKADDYMSSYGEK